MARVGILFPNHKRTGFCQNKLPFEQFQTNADMNFETTTDIMGRESKPQMKIMNDCMRWELFKKDNPLPNQNELQFKQPNPINIPMKQLMEDMPVIPYADNILTAQFLRDRRATNGIINSKQMDRLLLLKKMKTGEARKKQISTLDFNPLNDVMSSLETYA